MSEGQGHVIGGANESFVIGHLTFFIFHLKKELSADYTDYADSYCINNVVSLF
jgi:hypothetical protein